MAVAFVYQELYTSSTIDIDIDKVLKKYGRLLSKKGVFVQKTLASVNFSKLVFLMLKLGRNEQ